MLIQYMCDHVCRWMDGWMDGWTDGRTSISIRDEIVYAAHAARDLERVMSTCGRSVAL